jgi:hypothetical protein
MALELQAKEHNIFQPLTSVNAVIRILDYSGAQYLHVTWITERLLEHVSIATTI